MTPIDDKARERGIEVELPDERGTSSSCSVCGNEDDDSRVERGSWKCDRCGVVTAFEPRVARIVARSDGQGAVPREPASPFRSAENGSLLVGAEEHAAELRRQLTARESDQQSPRDRLDAALDRIDDHLGDGDAGVSATGEAEDDG